MTAFGPFHPNAAAILAALSDGETLSSKEIGDRAGLRQPVASQSLQTLTVRGYVLRLPVATEDRPAYGNARWLYRLAPAPAA